MTSKSVGALVGAVVLAVGFWSYPANALTFQFSFNNDVNNDPAQSLVVSSSEAAFLFVLGIRNWEL